jgi:hypothetical protein
MMTKKFKGRGKRIADTTIFGLPASVYQIIYAEQVTIHNGEMIKETHQYLPNGTVTIEAEIVNDV